MYGKKLLRGLAKRYVNSENGIVSWIHLKVALLKEFKNKVNSAEIHKKLTSKKRSCNESIQEYRTS